MDAEELEAILESQTEAPSLDFKAPMEWSVTAFAKDILAMSNIAEGGRIVIGVTEQEGGFVRAGVTRAIKDSYNVDAMKDQMTRFADPHIDLSVYFPTDGTLEYVVIRVFPFKEIPVICRRDDDVAGTKAGTIYYRNSNRRVESAAISNSYDMRTLIETATVKKMRQMRELGFAVEDTTPPPQVTNPIDALNEELGGL